MESMNHIMPTTAVAASRSTGMAMAMPTGMSMTIPSSTAAGEGEMLMGMSAMSMTFFHSLATPLFWDWWKPSGPAQYASTCVFLVILAAATRVLFAIRPFLFTGSDHHRHHQPLDSSDSNEHSPLDERQPLQDDSGGTEKTTYDVEEGGVAARRAPVRLARRWWSSTSFRSRLWRGSCEAVLVCLGYFL